jgi:hypothetical protein
MFKAQSSIISMKINKMCKVQNLKQDQLQEMKEKLLIEINFNSKFRNRNSEKIVINNKITVLIINI